MDSETAERFAEIDDYLSEVEDRLRLIARQNATLAEMVEVLGGYVNTSIEHLQSHVNDPEAHQGP